MLTLTVPFLSTPSARRATSCQTKYRSSCMISIHALREEGDALSRSRLPKLPYFYPRPPRGGRPGPAPSAAAARWISIHALREEGDVLPIPTVLTAAISIHALREEGDRVRSFISICHINFYPRPPRGGRLTSFIRRNCGKNFYPRPPRGGRPLANIGEQAVLNISIHALREEGDWGEPVGGRDFNDFYPRPPRGGRPSIPKQAALKCNFYPRPPRGGRRITDSTYLRIFTFLSTPSARRATSADF